MNRLRSTFIIGTVLACVAIFTASRVLAYVPYKLGNTPFLHWGKEVKFYAGTNTFPEGGLRRAALETAISRWNESPGAFVFRTPYWNAANLKRGNGDDEIWMANDDFVSKYPMRAFLVFADVYPPRIHESDVVINPNRNWAYYEVRDDIFPYGGPKRAFHAGLIHEMGHALGLRHVNTIYNVMGDADTHVHTNGEAVRHYVGEDAGNADVQMYGVGSTLVNDLAVSHWKYSKADGEYSEHIETKIYPPGSNNPIFPETYDGFLRFPVTKGTIYDVQFTYENNGRDNFNGVDIGFYLATKNVITTLSPKIGSATLSFYRNTPNTIRIPVQIPNSAISGMTYYLGVIVDDTASINEFVEANNSSYLQIRIK